MSFTIPLSGQVSMLEDICEEPCTLRLFANDIEPASDDGADDYQEAEGGGYAPKQIDLSMWTIGDDAVAMLARQIFTFESAIGYVYGYFVTSDEDGSVRFADRLSSPMNVQNAGDNVGVSIEFSLRQI